MWELTLWTDVRLLVGFITKQLSNAHGNMSTADLELITPRADNKRLRELTKVKDQLLVSKNQEIAYKDAIILQNNGQPQQYTMSPQLAGLRSNWQRENNNSSSSISQTAESPLNKDEILDRVFLYVGGGEHLYVAAVNRRWRGRYLQHCVQNGTTKYIKKLVTRHRSVLVTASRLQLVLNCGLAVKEWPMDESTYPNAICIHSTEPQQVFALLRMQGVPLVSNLCTRAAMNAKLPLLQWLRKSSCPWSEITVLYAAARGGSVAMLEWLLTVTSKWTSSVKQQMLNHAGWNGKLDAVQWLRARGAIGLRSLLGSTQLLVLALLFISAGACQQCSGLQQVAQGG
jgi:hypothetical protein